MKYGSGHGVAWRKTRRGGIGGEMNIGISEIGSSYGGENNQRRHQRRIAQKSIA